MTKARRKLLIGTAMGVSSIAFGVILTAFASVEPHSPESQGALWMVGLAVLFTAIGAVTLSVLWMRTIDEAAREAHKWAWFWGGSSGMGVGLIGVVLATMPHAASLRIPGFAGRSDPAAYAATGAYIIVLLVMLGYAIAWAWWWLGKR